MDQPTTPRSARTPRVAAVMLWTSCAAWAGVIFWFSSKTGSQIPGGYSVIGHLGEYGVFGTLLYGALRTSGLGRRRALVAAIAAASTYGITDEIHQHFVPGRTPDPLDWTTDTFGAAVGAALAQLAEQLRPRTTSEEQEMP